MTEFAADTYQNEFLAAAPPTSTRWSRSSRRAPTTSSPDRAAAEIVIVDVSGSMKFPRTKIKAAITATCAAIDCIRDGVLFAVIAGTDEARQVYPTDAALVAASATTRGQAKEAAGKLKAAGGTAIGRWLTAANSLLGDEPPGICHAILLTDGENQNETPEELEAALQPCEGRFQCDCRGVGADWEVSELRTIASKLLGTVEAIREPEDLVADFTATMERAMGRRTSNVSLRVWTPVDARVTLMQQVFPTIEDLTDRRATIGELEGDYPTGAWGDETRHYHVSIEVPAREVGDEMLAGRLKLVVDDVAVSEAKVRAIWTDDDAKSTLISPELAHFTGQEELSRVIDEAFAARRDGDEDTATREVREGRADRERARRHAEAPSPRRRGRDRRRTDRRGAPEGRHRRARPARPRGGFGQDQPAGVTEDVRHVSAGPPVDDHRLLRQLRCAYGGRCASEVGAPIDAGAPASVEVSSVTELRAPVAPAEVCPRCSTERVAGDRYCENDGYDFDDPSSTPGSWVAVVTADRARYDLLSPEGIDFPDHVPTLTRVLDADTVTVGRTSATRGIHPDIDLSQPPEDPGVSREHLRLERTADARYAVVDCGSANGTTLNDDLTPIPPGTPVPLSAGDRIHLGAWTTITVQAEDPSASA